MKLFLKSLGLFRFVFVLLFCSVTASAFEMAGLVTYNINQLSSHPTNYIETNNGIGYSFFGRLDLGPGQIESGFLYTPIGVSQTIAGQSVTNQGSYWILPLLYRYVFLPPFFSIAAGFDYALVGNNDVLVANSPIGVSNVSSGFKSHFGYQISLEATQDIGENLAALLDIRYRGGLGNAIYFPNQPSTRYSSWIIGLGIQKHLE